MSKTTLDLKVGVKFDKIFSTFKNVANSFIQKSI